MLTDETIICLAPDPWEGLWRNRHQIMTRLARRNTVLYVEPRLYHTDVLRYLRTGRLKLADLRQPLAWRYSERSSSAAHGLWIYHDPYYAPVAGRFTGGWLTAALRRRAMARTLRQIGAPVPPILWLVRPYYADVIGQYGEKLLVYHVTDEPSAYTHADHQALTRQQERAVLGRADLTIVTSPALLASKRPFNPHTCLVPNAVDYEGFQRSLAADRPIAPLAEAEAEVKAKAKDEPKPQPNLNHPPPIPRPRIGYSGALNEKIDFALLAHVATSRPDWQLVLIGARDLFRQPAKADPLAGLPNVHWLGRLPVTQLPPAIASMDVCLLPYERNEWTANIDSLKLYEYLACGRPIVSTDVPVAHAFAEVVRIGRDPAEFVAQIAAALAAADQSHDNSAAATARRKTIASQNTWDQRVATIETLLAEALHRKREG